MAEVRCLPAEVILLRPLRSLPSSVTLKTAVGFFFSAPGYTGVPSICTKFKALDAFGCGERVAEM